MKDIFDSLLLIFLTFTNICFMYQYEVTKMKLNECFESGELISPDGKKIQCLFLNSDEFAEKGE